MRTAGNSASKDHGTLMKSNSTKRNILSKYPAGAELSLEKANLKDLKVTNCQSYSRKDSQRNAQRQVREQLQKKDTESVYNDYTYNILLTPLGYQLPAT